MTQTTEPKTEIYDETQFFFTKRWSLIVMTVSTETHYVSRSLSLPRPTGRPRGRQGELPAAPEQCGAVSQGQRGEHDR